MIESNLSLELYREYHKICNILTYLTVALVCVVAVIIWIFGIDVGGQRTTIMGLMLMILAVFTFKIPNITYRYMLGKYKNQAEALSILGADWKQFRDAAMQHR